MTITEIIKQQLICTNRMVVWSWGVSKWISISENTLALRVNARRLNGFVCIFYNESCDAYDISFYSNKTINSLINKPVTKFATVEEVYCDQLVECIDEKIEKIPEYSF